jgi:galactitol-specific phosphotransferase system IIC component
VDELFFESFDMTKICFRTVQSLQGTNTIKGFTGTINTDGVDLDFICDRPIIKEVPLTPKEIKEKVGDLGKATVWGVDLGIRSVFVASDGEVGDQHRVRQTSLG